MLYYPSQVSRNIFSSVALTAAYTGNAVSFTTEGFSKLSLDISYAMGATETLNTMEIKLDASHNGSDWYTLVIDETTTVSEISPRAWQISVDGNYNIIVDIAYKFMRCSIKETGVVTNAGTASITYTLSGQ